MITDEFEEIILKWSKFAEDQRNTPILELFSSIIKDKSIG